MPGEGVEGQFPVIDPNSTVTDCWSPSVHSQDPPQDSIAHATPLAPAEQLLTNSAMSPYWHADKPGRLPVRVVATAAIADRPGLKLHGQPIQWATAGSVAGATDVQLDAAMEGPNLVVTLRYPVEGVVATATFEPYRHGGWMLVGAVRVVEQ